MQETLHYLLMSDHLMVQKALVANVKDTGLTPGNQKYLTICFTMMELFKKILPCSVTLNRHL